MRDLAAGLNCPYGVSVPYRVGKSLKRLILRSLRGQGFDCHAARGTVATPTSITDTFTSQIAGPTNQPKCLRPVVSETGL